MKKLTLFLLIVLQSNIQAMENDTLQEKWKIEKIILPNQHVKKAMYNEPSKQLFCLDNNNVTLTNIDDEKQSIILSHDSGLWEPSFDKSGHYILTSPSQETITLSNTNGKEIITIKQPAEIKAKIVKFNRGGNQILIADKNNIKLRNLDGILTANCILTESEYPVKFAKFFPNNDNLIFLGPLSYPKGYRSLLWDVRSKNFIVYDYIDPLKQISLHPEETYLAGIPDNSVETAACIYDLRKKGYLQLTNSKKPRSAKFNSQGTRILTKYYSLALLWNTAAITQRINTQKEYTDFTLQFDPANFSSAQFHPEGNNILIYSTERHYNPENSLTIYDLLGNQLIKIPYEKKMCSAKYNKTGNYIITRHTDNTVNLWKKLK